MMVRTECYDGYMMMLEIMMVWDLFFLLQIIMINNEFRSGMGIILMMILLIRWL